MKGKRDCERRDDMVKYAGILKLSTSVRGIENERKINKIGCMTFADELIVGIRFPSLPTGTSSVKTF